MASLTIRQAVSSDIAALTRLDHGYSTDHVWQMGFQDGPEGTRIRFQEVRLPRPMRVTYPREPERLMDDWTTRAAVLVAELEEEPVGYTSLVHAPAPGASWMTDVVVDLRYRRQGHASSLVQAAQRWSAERDFDSLFMEMQSKNYPAIQLARKMGFSFCGYSDRYFPDEDIALFFALSLR